MSQKLVLTTIGKEKLEKELEDLAKVRRPEVIAKIEAAKEHGDLSENAEYHEAKDEQGMIESRIREINEILRTAEFAGDHDSGHTIEIGSEITVDIEGEVRDFTIVGFNEQNPSEGKISNESPMGQAFIGHAEGDMIDIKVPKGILKIKILKVK